MKNSILTSGIFLFTALFSISCNGDKSSTREEIEDKTATEVPIQEEVDYLKKGKGIAMQTKGSLGKYLIAALSTLGPEGALGFCNTKAIPITVTKAMRDLDEISIIVSKWAAFFRTLDSPNKS